MAQFNSRHGSRPNNAYKQDLRRPVRNVSSLQAKIAAFEQMVSDTANTANSCYALRTEPERQLKDFGSLKKPVSVRAQSFRHAEAQRDTNSYGFSPYLQLKANANVSSKTSMSPASALAKPAQSHYRRQEVNTPVKSETREPNMPPNNVIKQPSLTDSDAGRCITDVKRPRLTEMWKSNYERKRREQNKLQGESNDRSVPKNTLPSVFSLGSPPPKPKRPPCVDINRFRRNTKSSNDGAGTKLPHTPRPPRLPSRPSFYHTASLNQELDNNDARAMTPPAPPTEGPPSQRKERPKGTIGQGEVTGQRIKAKKKKKKQQKQKTKQKKDQGAKNKPEIKGCTVSEHDREEVKESKPGSNQSEAEIDIYDDTETLAQVCSGLAVQTLGDDGVYANTDNPDTRVSALPQSPTDDDGVYANADSQSTSLPFEGYNIYAEVAEDY